MLTAIILISLFYVALFVVLWGQARFEERPQAAKATVKVTPWGAFLHIEAPSDAVAADALLRADLLLEREGK